MKSIFKILFIIIITNSFLQAMEKIEISVNDKKLIVDRAGGSRSEAALLTGLSVLAGAAALVFIQNELYLKMAGSIE